MLRSLAPSLRQDVLRRFSCSVELLSKKKLERRGSRREEKALPGAFVKQLKSWPRLLQKEIEAQNEHIRQFLTEGGGDWTEIEARGLGLSGLRFVQEFFDPIDGKVLVYARESSRRHGNKGFRVGAPVVLAEADTLQNVAECIYLKSNAKEITLKLCRKLKCGDYNAEKDYCLLPSQDAGCLQSLQENLEVQKAAKAPGASLINLAYRGAVMPSVHNDRVSSQFSDELNASQARAVAAALNNKRPFVCIQGPPGTGKTRVVAEIVRLLSERGQKLLVCAPSHVAVDTVMAKTVKVMKADQIVGCSVDEDELFSSQRLDEAMAEHPSYFELQSLSDRLSQFADFPDEKAGLTRKFSQLKYQMMAYCYKRRRVIFCTLTSSIIQRLSWVGWQPDVIIVDESAMCIEPQAWAAIIKAKRCILVGDHAQLPPVILSKEAEAAGLSISLMQRLSTDFCHSNLSFLLSTQYRMNEVIMRWSSDHFYESRLTADDSNRHIRLSDICALPEEDAFNSPMVLCDTGGRSHFREERHRLSFRNFHEASFVASYVSFLLSHGLSGQSIGVITPYYAQMEAIREMVPTDVAVNTVNGFQGQEREVIIFSLVRNNPGNVIGFLSEARRMNVAVTRAKRQFCLVGNSRSMGRSQHLKSLLSYMKKHGQVYKTSDVDFSMRYNVATG